jgi:hypothetical protein
VLAPFRSQLDRHGALPVLGGGVAALVVYVGLCRLLGVLPRGAVGREAGRVAARLRRSGVRRADTLEQVL